MYSPTNEEWMIRGALNYNGLQITNGKLIKEGFTHGPYMVSDSPVLPAKRTRGFDHAIYDGAGRPQWCGTLEECNELAEKWNTSYALFLMARGTAAEMELYGDKTP